MTPLPLQLRKNGHDYTQVRRGRKSFIYEQRVKGYDRIINYYEVFKLQIKPAKIIFGNSLPKREIFPADTDFGSKAWTYMKYDQAIQKFNELENA